MRDRISLVESGYDLSGDLESWLRRVLDAAAPLLDAGGGVAGIVFDDTDLRFRIDRVVVRGGVPELVEYVRAANDDASADGIATAYRSGMVAATLSETVFATVPGTGEQFERSNQGRYRDAMGVVAPTGVGTGLALSTPLAEPRPMAPGERASWTRIAAHLGAGLRLRSAFEGGLSLDHGDVEAILSPAGAVLDARGAAQPRDARDQLRAGARARERARARRRGAPDEALALWEALIHGRWSIVDHFEGDGRRFVVACRNDPRFADLRGLTQRERQVAAFVGLGRTTKEIAYLLGVGETAVGNAVRRAQAKLGLRSRAELASFFAPGGLCASLTRVSLAGEPLALGSYPVFAADALSRLTDAEREIAIALLRGDTNAEIARRRGSAVRTVANQVRAIFDKFDVHSRAELAVALRPREE
jgi:DNA-binding NarL/FixJ family response regulator